MMLDAFEDFMTFVDSKECLVKNSMRTCKKPHEVHLQLPSWGQSVSAESWSSAYSMIVMIDYIMIVFTPNI